MNEHRIMVLWLSQICTKNLPISLSLSVSSAAGQCGLSAVVNYLGTASLRL